MWANEGATGAPTPGSPANPEHPHPAKRTPPALSPSAKQETQPMDPTAIAALTTALAGLLAALAQWSWLMGPRRNGRRARIPHIEDRLARTEHALERCLSQLRRKRRPRRRRRPPPQPNF